MRTRKIQDQKTIAGEGRKKKALTAGEPANHIL